MKKNEIIKKEVRIDTSKLFLFNLPHFIKYLFSWEVLPMIGIFSLAFILMPFSTLVYVFLNLIIIMMVYKFAFDVLADTARGHMRPAIRHNYLVTNAIAVKVALLALLIEGSLMWMNHNGYDGQEKYYFLMIAAFLTPAIYMILALTNSLYMALNPLIIFKVIRTAHLSYFLFVGFWLATISLHEVIINPFVFNYFPIFLNGIVSSFIEYSFLILNFQIMGYIIFQNRDAFELESIGFGVVTDDNVVIEKIVVNPIYDRMKMLLADDQAELALAMAIELKKDGDHSAELEGLYKKAMQRKLYNPSNVDIANKIHRRIKNQQISQAFNMLIEHLDEGKDFVEESPEDISPLVKHAAQINKPQYIAPLLKEYHVKYPYHCDIVPNYFILAKILYDDRATRDKSKELLKGLISKYPGDKHMTEIKSWYKGVELMSK